MIGHHWKIEILAETGADPDVIEVQHAESYAGAIEIAAAEAPARVALAEIEDPAAVYYIRHGRLDDRAPARFRREVQEIEGLTDG